MYITYEKARCDVCGVWLYAGQGQEGQQLKASLSHVESLGLHEAL